MTVLSGRDIGTPRKATASPKVYLTPKEASEICRMSVSWLAKARMNGDGPLCEIRTCRPLRRDGSSSVDEDKGTAFNKRR
jgi:hypothetical protein